MPQVGLAGDAERTGQETVDNAVKGGPADRGKHVGCYGAGDPVACHRAGTQNVTQGVKNREAIEERYCRIL
jgi:hypothetical protein